MGSLPACGGIGDGQFLNTRAIESAVENISAAGGGTLTIPSGTWLTGPFNMTSDMTLYLEAGAKLVAAGDPSLWPIVAALPTYGQSRNRNVPYRTGAFIG